MSNNDQEMEMEMVDDEIVQEIKEPIKISQDEISSGKWVEEGEYWVKRENGSVTKVHKGMVSIGNAFTYLLYIYGVHFIIVLIALYLSIRCNNGFDLPAFLMACCCPYLYIIYIMAAGCGR